MVNKINEMKKINYIFWIVFLSCGTTKVTSNVRKSMVEIYFNDFFKNDKISLRLCECQIFKDVNLNSNVVGYTGIRVKGFLENDYSFQFDKKIKNCKSCNSDNLKVEILFNNQKEIFIIKIQKGKYIGFNKNNNGLILTQQFTPFEYE
jgi:hypothetical protein